MQNNSPLSTLIHSQARKYGNRTAMKYKDYAENKWKDISWNAFSETVRLVSNAMMELGMGIQENIAVFSQNMPECMYVDFGAYAIRAVTIPFYATSSEMQVKYMVSDAKVRYIFVGEQYQYDTAYRVLKIEHCVCGLIIFDRSVKKDEQDKVSIRQRSTSVQRNLTRMIWPTFSIQVAQRALAKVSCLHTACIMQLFVLIMVCLI